MGSWIVRRVLAMAPVTALTVQESKELVGRAVTYSATSFHTGNVHFRVKSYTSRTMSKDEFFTQNKLSLSKLGVSSSRVTELAVIGADQGVADQFGAWVYPVTSGLCIVSFQGVFSNG
jgi:hypothetical protein